MRPFPKISSALLTALAFGAFPASGDYLQDVKPVLTRHCVACHGADQQKAGLRLDTAEALRKGGDSGPGIVPKSSGQSLAIQVIEGAHDSISRMPYKKPPLAHEELDAIRAWIDEGAPAPANEAPGRFVHWAFVPPVRETPPDIAAHPIDAFIRDRLARENIEPSPEADPITLLRRLHLDLTGLPPTPGEVDSYLGDSRPEAYERRVDQLLQSPHHGERWARWWLDVARYADSNGYSIDAPRSLWPWRDWVIRAFHEDKPFDTFIVEQLAGDLLPDATLDQRIATGFHRNTQINQEGGIDPEQFRIESIIDRVNTTGTAFLGLTVGCAQCHDHKFDPISQREYFQLFAFLNNQDEPTLPIPTPEQQAARDWHDTRVRRLEAELKALTADTGNPPAGESFGKTEAPAASADASSGAAKDAQDTNTAPDPARIRSELKRLQRSRPGVDTTLVLVEREKPRESYVFIKGDFTRRGPDVTPATPAVLHPSRFPEGRLPTRLDLARWIVDPANPLTARVTVNRVWQQYFGRGLVETENDFGTQGIPPTHPRLLDWLATELIREKWSLHALHRLIVTSATYRQSSHVRPDLANRDANNRLLARQNRLRLDAEIIRDVALAASGKLDRTVGGPGVYPPQPAGVMNLGQSRREWLVSDGGDRYRRGLYTFFWRATPHPALAVFDAPDAFSACTRRLRSNTPLQALTLLNDAAFVELAGALAERITREAPPEGRIDLGFRLCLARSPSPTERARLQDLVRAEARDFGEPLAWQSLARVLLNLDETITRE
ncbi:MAG: PSD1 and planctomycete cytochrome C domain-containing protein, partial [Limisphaerales bacterium]